jgi:hypothetical protein
MIPVSGFLGSQRRDLRRRRILWVVTVVVAAAIAMPDQLPAAPASTQFRSIASTPGASEMLLAHCCHAHPLPPYDSYCCHSGAAYVGRAVYGAPSVRAQSRQVARRTSRRVSRRR